MEVMEIDENEDVPSANKDQMWKTLISAIAPYIIKRDKENFIKLKNVLDMMQNSLTFEDPGMFLLKPLSKADQDDLEFRYLWLLNTLMLITLDDEQKICKDSNLDLQKDMLAASLIKQPWWFFKSLFYYTEILKQVLEYEANSDDASPEVIINIFPTNEYKFLDMTMTNHVIAIRSNQSAEEFIDTIITILTHGVPFVCNSNKEQVKRCSEVVFKVLQCRNLNLKIKAIIYFIKLLKATHPMDALSKILIINILTAVQDVYDMVTSQTASDEEIGISEINRFNLTNLKLVTELQQLDIKYTKQESEQIVLILCRLASNYYLEQGLIDQKLFLKCIDYLDQILMSSTTNTNYSLETVMSLVTDCLELPVYPHTIKLLEFCVMAEVKQNLVDNQLSQSSSTWKKLELTLKTKLTDLGNQNDPEIFMHDLMIINSILKLSNCIENSFLEFHQKRHLNNPECFCSKFELVEDQLLVFEEFDFKNVTLCPFDQLDLVKQMIEAINKKKDVTLIDVVTLMDISFQFLVNSSSRNLPASLKVTLMSILLSPFINFYKKINYCQIMTRLPASIKQSYNQKDVTEKIKTMQGRSLDLLSGLSLKKLDPLFEKLNFDLFEFILSQIGEQALISKLCKCFLSSMIYNADDLKLYLELFQKSLGSKNIQLAESFVPFMKNIICLASKQAVVHKVKENDGWQIKINCRSCCKSTSKKSFDMLILEENGVLLSVDLFPDLNHKLTIEPFYYQINSEAIKCGLIKSLSSYYKHCKINPKLETGWTKFLTDDNLVVLHCLNENLPEILGVMVHQTPKNKCELHALCIKELLKLVERTFRSKDEDTQLATIKLICSLANVAQEEKTLLDCIRMSNYFLVSNFSLVSREASLMICEMCDRNNVTPIKMFNWYQRIILKLVITLCVTNYFSFNSTMMDTLNIFAKTLDFDSPITFIEMYCPLIVATLLPEIIEDPELIVLLEEVNSITMQDMATNLGKCFRVIYPHVHNYEDAAVSNACMQFVYEKTHKNIVQLINLELMDTMAEILVHYHKNPECVLSAFRSLLMENNNTTTVSSETIAEFIAELLLGVLTYFESVLNSDDREKATKMKVVLSLGDIIRLMGSKLVTQFRFKIIAFLKTALECEEVNLEENCVKVWKVFTKFTDVRTLGPLLRTIFVSLEAFSVDYQKEVNEIYEYLVVENSSLLSVHIQDLFFIEETKVPQHIKTLVANQTSSQRPNDTFLEQLRKLCHHIGHENSAVRVYGIKFLTDLLRQNRNELNQLIISKIRMDPVMEEILGLLMQNCKSTNEELKLKAAECLGEIGAIEPGFHSPNYAPQKPFSDTIHSDEFAINALEQLACAYQFQNEHSNHFSLAMQEILRERGVTNENKNDSALWSAISERTRHFVEPMLRSTYTINVTTDYSQEHPIFTRFRLMSPLGWAFIWCNKMIDLVAVEPTQYLLESFKPCFKRSMEITRLFLPYVLLHSVEEGLPEIHTMIFEEFKCIIDTMMEEDEEEDELENLDLMNETSNRDVKMQDFMPSNDEIESDDLQELATKCTKLIFDSFDFLNNWAYSRENRNSTAAQSVRGFLNQFDTLMLAKANFRCGEFARSLINLEAYIKVAPEERLQEQLLFLAKIYAELDDPDSMEGLKCVKTAELTLDEQILINTKTGKLHESAACFEMMMQNGDPMEMHIKELVGCYVGLNQPETALHVSDSLLKKLYEKNMGSDLQEIMAEPLWRLGRFEELEKLVETSNVQNSSNWGVRCGLLFLKFRQNDHEGFVKETSAARLAILKLLKSSDMEVSSYQKAYQEVLKLHVITEFDKSEICVNKIMREPNFSNSLKIFGELTAEWNSRSKFLQPTPAVMEPVMCIRRILLEEIKQVCKAKLSELDFDCISTTINAEIGQLWINSTKYACKNKMFQQAHQYILSAEPYKPKELFIQKAKFFWKKGDQSNALKILERGITELGVAGGSAKDPKLYGDSKLLKARYNAEAVMVEFETTVKYFQEAISANKHCEEAYLMISEYKEKGSKMKNISLTKDGTRSYDIMETYAKSMCYGCQYLYQSMPRFLSIWLDFTDQVSKDHTERQNKLETDKMTGLVNELLKKLPLYYFYTAFSQLVSRICHPNKETLVVLQNIIIKLVYQHPQQSLWFLVSSFKSSDNNRVKRCNEIFADKRLMGDWMQKLIREFYTLADKLLELNAKEIIGHPTGLKVSSLVPVLPKLFRPSVRFSKIVLPIQANLQMVRDITTSSFMFPHQFVHFHAIKEEMIILSSMQKPRKITIVGDDGNSYSILMKDKDDLRLDNRFMEFSGVVNEYLHKDSEARHRRLHIRTNAVIPLNENSGIIEWVPNLKTFKNIVTEQYKKNGTRMPGSKELKDMNMSSRPVEERRKMHSCFLINHPPVLGTWFLEQFPTPHNYFQARLAYIKSTAVMSMMGYIMGLGDRHGENILFDTTTGQTYHVDFNCIFNKGESLTIPETVPFRLTQNMVDALGPLGVEGLFRKCCEVVLRVLQKESSILLSYLQPFIYDTLVSRSVESGRSSATTAQKNIWQLEARLNRLVKYKKDQCNQSDTQPISLEGQVTYVIDEARSLDNLSKMFFGWGAWM